MAILASLTPSSRVAIPNANQSNATALNVDADDWGAPVQGLLRFDDLFGNQPGQIALDDAINSAVLELNVLDPGSSLLVYEMMQSWSDTDTWNSLGNGIQTNGIEAASTSVASHRRGRYWNSRN